MKKIIFLLFNFYLTICALAQDKTVKLDTINISGRLIAGDGTKLSNIYIETKSQHNQYLNLKVGATTDSLGNFKLEGIKPTDTLNFFALNNEHTFINNGSRFLNITVWPSIRKFNLETLVITAKRITPQKIKDFKLSYLYNAGCCNITLNPQYPGGEKKFLAFLYENLKYPTLAIKNNIEGTVTVEFTITKDGTLIFPKIINGLGFGCDEAVLEVLKHSKRWNPGVRNGRPIVMSYQTDVIFKLID